MSEVFVRRGPLDDFSWPMSDAFAISLAPPAARFILRGDERVAAAAVGAPTAPRSVQSSERRAILWLGPDEWLIIGENVAAAALAGLPHSLVDVSQRQIGLEISGSLAARALSAGCPLDLRNFAEGRATRTMLAKAEIVLWGRGPERFHVEVWRSFARYAACFLVEAARRAPR